MTELKMVGYQEMTNSLSKLGQVAMSAEEAINKLNYSFAVKILLEASHHATKTDEYYIKYFTLLGIAFDYSKQLIEAVEAYNKVLEVASTNLDALVGQGNVLLKLSQFDKALNLFKSAVMLEPSNPRGYMGLANYFQLQHKFIEALEAISEASRFDTENRHYNLIEVITGRIFFDKNDYEQAIRHFENALRHNDKNANVWMHYGRTLMALNKFEKAKIAVQQAITLAPDFGEAYYWLGAIELNSGNYKYAENIFQKSINLSPNDSKSYVGLAQSSLRIRHFIIFIKTIILLFWLECKKENIKYSPFDPS